MDTRSTRERLRSWTVPLLTGAAAAALYVATLQADINGSSHPYATDVGEIQNALPRWGTIHFTGYPLYTLTGSFLVTLLRARHVPPAAGSSAVSLVWATLAVAILARLGVDLGARPLLAAGGALVFAFATSTWMNASIAEVHALTVLFTVACLWLAIRFGRDGRPMDLGLLALALSQAVMHMRAVLFLAPALLVLVWPKRRPIMTHWAPALAICLLSPLVYLYMPLRKQMGATWTFGQTSTWHGFWQMILDVKADRIVRVPGSIATLGGRLKDVLGLLNDDLPLLLQGLGLVGLLAAAEDRQRSWRLAVGLSLAWLPYAALALVIWEGRISDGLLAVKLPVAGMAALGLALGATWLAGRLADQTATLTRDHKAGRPAAGVHSAAFAAVAVVAALIARRDYPKVVAVTRHRSVEAAIHTAQQIANPARPTNLVAPWGLDYWGLMYAKAYRGDLVGVRIVDHNADVAAIAGEGDAIVALADTRCVLPLDWWKKRLGAAFPDGLAPGLVEPRTARREGAASEEASSARPVNEDLSLADASATVATHGSVVVALDWLARQKPARNYSVAVHLVAAYPPKSASDVLAEVDTADPVDGWYPTKKWSAGQLVRDTHRLQPPAGSHPVAVLVTAYYQDGSGSFVDGAWLSLPLTAATMT